MDIASHGLSQPAPLGPQPPILTPLLPWPDSPYKWVSICRWERKWKGSDRRETWDGKLRPWANREPSEELSKRILRHNHICDPGAKSGGENVKAGSLSQETRRDGRVAPSSYTVLPCNCPKSCTYLGLAGMHRIWDPFTLVAVSVLILHPCLKNTQALSTH